MTKPALDTTLHRRAGRWGAAWAVALAIAFGLQIAGLLMPFLRIAVFIKGGEDYSLLRSVWLLWQGGLHLLALLITGFSIVFPFLKIGVLAWAWFRMPAGPSRTHTLEWMGRLGKWSMLDPLSVLVLVLLATDQWAVSTTTFLGVYAFLTAVATTMWLSIAASALDAADIRERAEDSRSRLSLARRSGPLGVLAIAVLALAAALLAGALGLPFMQVNQFLLRSNEFGVGSVPATMAHDGNWPLAFLSTITLVAMPALTVLAELWAWLVPATPHAHRRRWRWIGWAREWCMLDVMALALGLFLMEGQSVIRVDVKHGLWLLIATAMMLWLSGWLGQRAAARGIERLDHAKM
jgi:paraquat-inducible protein A